MTAPATAPVSPVAASWGRDRSGYVPDGSPHSVTHAGSVADVQRAVVAGRTRGLDIVIRGAGSGLAGGASAGTGSTVIDLSGLDRILAIDPVDQIAVVEPGVVVADLDLAAREHGLFYAPDPGSAELATVGGTIATNAGGLRGAKYGVTRDAVLALDVVLADGSLVHLGRPTLKGVVGIDLVSTVVGSEGTLGVVVGATVRLLPAPSGSAVVFATFRDVPTAGEASAALAVSGTRPSMIELIDARTLAAIDALRHTTLASGAGAVLIVQTDGFGARAEIDAVARVLSATALTLETTTDPDRALQLTAARRDALPAVEARGRVLIEDIVVPRSRLGEAFRRIDEITARSGVDIFVFAHAGDGNIHPIISLPGIGEDDPIPDRAVRAADEVFRLALDLGGSVSGEHGVGVLKRAWLERELGADVLALQRRVVRAFDPDGVFNRGKSV